MLTVYFQYCNINQNHFNYAYYIFFFQNTYIKRLACIDREPTIIYNQFPNIFSNLSQYLGDHYLVSLWFVQTVSPVCTFSYPPSPSPFLSLSQLYWRIPHMHNVQGVSIQFKEYLKSKKKKVSKYSHHQSQ